MLRQLLHSRALLRALDACAGGSARTADAVGFQWLPAATVAAIHQMHWVQSPTWSGHLAMFGLPSQQQQQVQLYSSKSQQCCGDSQPPAASAAAQLQPVALLVQQQQHICPQHWLQLQLGGSSAAGVAAGVWQQWQQRRGLLGVVRHKNYQQHNKKKPKKYKIKSPSIARQRVLVGQDGTMWRMQANRRHKRYKKSRQQLLHLKGMVPLHSADTRKLRKLGYKRTWWFSLKA